MATSGLALDTFIKAGVYAEKDVKSAGKLRVVSLSDGCASRVGMSL